MCACDVGDVMPCAVDVSERFGVRFRALEMLGAGPLPQEDTDGVWLGGKPDCTSCERTMDGREATGSGSLDAL